jgi:hypothetical protein
MRRKAAALKHHASTAMHRLLVGLVVVLFVGLAAALAMGLTIGMDVTVSYLDAMRVAVVKLVGAAYRWALG